ncbi:creatininase family protein [Ketogulonicigenium vulgare]|uniref:creatininase family protein n=1 Tax=Ketogulonicigenium vulgare TaxID=92945 RepID=UPI0023593256|nr:creatininase family protein [Ketogulonicigenium vulgare]
MTRKIWWNDFSASDFDAIDPMKTIAILPIAAVEQHGPHLPVGTDVIINTGHFEMLAKAAPADLDIRILPVQPVGKSNEHIWAKGTVSHEAKTLIDSWVEIGLHVARTGIRKLVIVNSHGGNEEIMGIVGRELRVRCGLFVVKTSWSRFGAPAGLISDTEARQGIHGGEVETALVLHFRPELVDMAKAGNFTSVAAAEEVDYTYLRPTGTHAWSWIASDVHPSGAIGNATLGTAEKGAAIAQNHVDRFLDLLAEVLRHPVMPEA